MSNEAFAQILEYTTNTFYNPDNKNISVQVRDDNYYDQTAIVLSKQLMEAFADLNLPRFTIYYHELGHHLYSQGIFDLEDRWRKVNTGPLAYNQKYHHLLNWIEDYYIEDNIVKDYPYLTDVLTCIKKLPPEYDINRIEYAFNFWYIFTAPTPALNYTDQIAFRAYIMRLLTLRGTNKTRFGSGPILSLGLRPTNETLFVQTLIEFYDWCQQKGIFPKDQALEDLDHPSNHLESSGGDGDVDNAQQDDGTEKEVGDVAQQGSKKGSHHDKGKHVTYEQKTHISKQTNFFKEDIVAERKLIEQQLLDMSNQVLTNETTLEGLFNPKLKDTSFIQSRVTIPNFFNPNRLIDQVLFREPTRTYKNVSIYRDVSGSVGEDEHALMSKVCDRLVNDIPVEIDYYLYSDNLHKTNYVSWETMSKTPASYRRFNLHGSTNSGLIADIITEQFSEKWLNIIITDGDLEHLMRRDNIYGLLQNVFVIYIGTTCTHPEVRGIIVENENDIHKVYNILESFNL